jgi:CRP-like cAMP-binding protein
MTKRACSAGEVIYRQGEPGHVFYVVAQGAFEVAVTSEPGSEASVVHHYTGGDHPKHKRGEPWSMFGEQALLFKKPRGSTVRAKVEGTLWTLRRAAFQHLVRPMLTKRAPGV